MWFDHLHNEEPICACGANTICKICGYCSGGIPCECSPKIDYWAWDELSDEALKNFEKELEEE